MKDWNSAIRKGYMAILQGIGGGVQVFYAQAPNTVTKGNKYIVLSTITGQEASDKNAYNGIVSVLLDIITEGDSVLNIADSESMVSSVKALINSNTNPVEPSLV